MLDYQSEIHHLQMEGEMSLDELIASLPNELCEDLLHEEGVLSKRLISM